MNFLSSPLEIDHELALWLSQRAGAQIGQCYNNCILAMFCLEDERQEAFYVEGWLAIQKASIFIEHGWLEVDGKIVDPTASLWMIGTPPQSSDYHPVFRWNQERIKEQMLFGHTKLPLFNKFPDYRREMAEAHAKLLGVIHQGA